MCPGAGNVRAGHASLASTNACTDVAPAAFSAAAQAERVLPVVATSSIRIKETPERSAWHWKLPSTLDRRSSRPCDATWGGVFLVRVNSCLSKGIPEIRAKPFASNSELVVTSLAEPARVQRHGNDKLSGYLVGHQMLAHDSTQLGSCCPQISVFQPVDRAPHYPIQNEWRPNPVNGQGNGPAGSAGRFNPRLATQPAKGRSQPGKFLQARRAEHLALF